jgi:hypothetical protein
LAAGGVIILLVAAPITMGGSIAELMLSLLGARIICLFLAWWLRVRVFGSFCVYTLLWPVVIGGCDVGVSVGAGSSPPTGGEPLVSSGAHSQAHSGAHSLASAGPHCLVCVRARSTLLIGREILVIVEGHLAASALAQSPAHSGAHCLISTGTETLPLVKAHALASTWAKRLRSAEAIGASCAESESRASAKTESLSSAGTHSPAHAGAYSGAHCLASARTETLAWGKAKRASCACRASTKAHSLPSTGGKCLAPAKAHSQARAWAPSLVCTWAHCLCPASGLWAGALLVLPVGHCRLPLLRVRGHSTSEAPALARAASSASAAWAGKGLTG